MERGRLYGGISNNLKTFDNMLTRYSTLAKEVYKCIKTYEITFTIFDKFLHKFYFRYF